MNFCEAINTIVPVQCEMGLGFWVAVGIVAFIVAACIGADIRINWKKVSK